MGTNQHHEANAGSSPPTVYVIDRDESVLQGIRSLLMTLDVNVRCFRSAEEFIASVDVGLPGCVITEVHLPRMSGLDLQEHLRERGIDVPVIVLASDSDVPMAVRAMLLGAVDFIEKPFVDRVLVARVRQALHSAA